MLEEVEEAAGGEGGAGGGGGGAEKRQRGVLMPAHTCAHKFALAHFSGMRLTELELQLPNKPSSAEESLTVLALDPCFREARSRKS